MSFELAPQLAADTFPVGDFDLSTLRLFDDSRYPWTILVPRVEGVREIYALAPRQRQALLDESCRVGAFMMEAFNGVKLNVGALGNLVPQLHLHHVVRFRDDPAWPGPVWGHSPRVPYGADERIDRIERLRVGLGLGG